MLIYLFNFIYAYAFLHLVICVVCSPMLVTYHPTEMITVIITITVIPQSTYGIPCYILFQFRLLTHSPEEHNFQKECFLMSLTHPTHSSLKLMYQKCMFLGRERVKICLPNLHTKKTHTTFTVLTSCFFVQTNQNHEHFLFLFALFCVCKSHFDKSQTNRKHCCFTHTKQGEGESV